MVSFDLFIHIFRVASLALGQSFDCPSASEATLKDMGKINQYQTTTERNKTQIVSIFLWIYCSLNKKYSLPKYQYRKIHCPNELLFWAKLSIIHFIQDLECGS